MRRTPIELKPDVYRELRAGALLRDRTLEKHIRDILSEWEMSKASENGEQSPSEKVKVCYLPIEPKVYASIRAAARRLGMSTKQAIVEACSENVVFRRQKQEQTTQKEAPIAPERPSTPVEPAPGVPDSRVATCLRCGYEWKRRTANPPLCPNPKCKSPDWNDAWTCQVCGLWFRPALRHGSVCRSHEAEPEPETPQPRWACSQCGEECPESEQRGDICIRCTGENE